jgi:uncharacterized protein (DUF1778 family)
MKREVKQFFVMVRLSRSDLALLDRYAEAVSRTRADAVRQAIALAANLIVSNPSPVGLSSQVNTDNEISA